MESKRMVMLVVMMLVMGNILIETEAIDFKVCYAGCVVLCGVSKHGVKQLVCPVKCLKDCTPQELSSKLNLNETELADYFCELGCVTHRCVSSSIEDKDHTEKVSVCVDSCSNTCSHKS